MDAKDINKINFERMFMGLVVAILFGIQQYHAIQVSDLKSNVVPRAEYEIKHQKVMNKDEILAALNMINARINSMEKNNANK